MNWQESSGFDGELNQEDKGWLEMSDFHFCPVRFATNSALSVQGLGLRIVAMETPLHLKTFQISERLNFEFLSLGFRVGKFCEGSPLLSFIREEGNYGFLPGELTDFLPCRCVLVLSCISCCFVEMRRRRPCLGL